MTILVISVDLECCRCRAKITKVLDCLKEEFCIEKVEFEDKLNKVIVRSKFSGEKLSKKIFCKAGRIVKEIKIVEVWPPPKPPEKPPTKPPPPKPEVKLVPYPYPLPYPLPSSQGWPWCPCPPQQPCQCPPPRPWCPCPPQQPCQCPPPRPWCPCPPHRPCQCPPTRPPCRCPPHKPCQCRPVWPTWPPRPPHCSCSKDDDGCSSCGDEAPVKPPCHCGGRPTWPPCSCGGPRPPICWPPPPGPWPGACPPWWCDVVTEENPGCSIM